METRFDEMAKLLAANMPRREALSRIAGLALGSVLGALGLAGTARAQQNSQGLCILLCRKAQRVQNIWRLCIFTCLNCPAATTQLCGTFGTVCCPAGTVCTAGVTCMPQCGLLGQQCCNAYIQCTQGVCDGETNTCIREENNF